MFSFTLMNELFFVACCCMWNLVCCSVAALDFVGNASLAFLLVDVLMWVVVLVLSLALCFFFVVVEGLVHVAGISLALGFVFAFYVVVFFDKATNCS